MYLASAELAAVSSALGKIPTMAEYMQFMSSIDTMKTEIYRYLNFDEIESFQQAAERAKLIPTTNIAESA